MKAFSTRRALLLACLCAATAGAKEPAPVVIKGPVTGGYVGPLEPVEGQVLRRGQPVVVVRPQLPGALWWVQEPAVPTTPGHFKARAQFGNSETEDGARFEIVVLLALNAAQAAPLKVGAAFEALPLEMPRSEMVVVTRGLPPRLGEQGEQAGDAAVVRLDELAVPLAPGAAPALGVDVQEPPELDDRDKIVFSPAPDEAVGRVAEVRGRAPVATHPVVLVRGDGDHAPWWVQDRPRVDDSGMFVSRVRCGTDRTAKGTAFHLLVLLPTTSHELRKLGAGRSLKELPIGMPRSRQITVKRE